MAVLDRRLSDAPYLAGAEYTIADIATWPWVKNAANYGQNMDNYPHVARWIKTIYERPAVKRGLKALEKAAA
jgi:GST-like protein